MTGSSVLTGGFAAIILVFAAGCAVLPENSSTPLSGSGAERNIVADAALAVQQAPWPKAEPVSFLARITGGGARVTRSDAIDAYLASLRPAGARFPGLEADARANIRAAHALNRVALEALDAPATTMNDVVLVEAAIQALREHREIYATAAKDLARRGEAVDEAALDAFSRDFRDAIRTLSRTADLLADRVAYDRSAAVAAPDFSNSRKFSDL